MGSLIFIGIGLLFVGILVGIGLCYLDKAKGMVYSSWSPYLPSPIILKEDKNG